MNFGQVAFNMNEEFHPSGSGIGAFYMLKRWKKYTIYAHTGPWVRTDNPRDNLYTTNSIYLYDYVIVTDDFWNSVVYTASFKSTVPGDPGSEVPQSSSYWYHYANTFQNSPNAVTNNYSYAYQLNTPFGGRLVAVPGHTTQSAQETYFEIVSGYPRNHYIHKRDLFSLYTLQTYGRNYSTSSVGTYVRCQQTSDTTIGPDGLANGSLPVETMIIGNVNVTNTNNVINTNNVTQTTPSVNTGQTAVPSQPAIAGVPGQGAKAGGASRGIGASGFGGIQPPNAPVKVSATATSARSITVNWASPFMGRDSIGAIAINYYLIYRNGYLLKTVAAGSNVAGRAFSYVDTYRVEPNRIYRYVIQSNDAYNGFSTPSQEVVVTTPVA